MKQYHLFYLLLLSFIFSSCNRDEGFGGSCSIEGYVYNVVHHNKNYSFSKDTIPAAEYRVYILAGENGAILDDIRANDKGMYRIDYLRKGTYPVYACSEYPNGTFRIEMKEVKAHKGLNKAETIYVHTGKAFGTSIITGSVFATYNHNGEFMDEGKAFGEKVYIKHAGEIAPFDDVDVGDMGIFAFDGILPGDYEIYVLDENKLTEKPTVRMMPCKVIDTEKVYHLDENVEIWIDNDGDGVEEVEYYTFHINVAV